MLLSSAREILATYRSRCYIIPVILVALPSYKVCLEHMCLLWRGLKFFFTQSTLSVLKIVEYSFVI